MSAAERAWQRFVALSATTASVVRDFHEWHQGRPHYAVWVIALEHGPWDARIAGATTALEGLLLPDYRCQPHITLYASGFPSTGAHSNDDYLPAQFQRQTEALRRLALKPFELRINGLSSFATAPYLEVADPHGALTRMRQALSVGGDEFRDTEYVPHVTVGFYANAHPLPHVAERIIPLREAASIPLHVRRIALMAYDSRVIGGPLETLCEFDLADNLLIGSNDFFV